MEQAEFDAVADEYTLMLGRSISASGETPEFFAHYISRGRFPAAAARYAQIAGSCLSLPDQQFDLAFSTGVFHHIPHVEHLRWLQELRRVTRPGGMLAVFENNPLNPLYGRSPNSGP